MGAVFNRVTLSATGQTRIAEAGGNAGEAGWELGFAGSSWTGSVVLKQNTAPPGSPVSLSSVAYFNATTGALVAAGTAITTAITVIVTDTGLDLYADYTHTAGTVQITCMSAGGQFGGVTVAAGDIAAGTFGAYSGASGTYTFPGALAITGAATGASFKSASPTGGIGFTAGAGGAQTQATNKQTTVVSNTITTAITMNNEVLNAAAVTAFTFTNSTIAATDTVLVTHESAGTSGAYLCNAFPGAGSAVISVRNITAGNLTEAIVLRVTVIKSVSA